MIVMDYNLLNQIEIQSTFLYQWIQEWMNEGERIALPHIMLVNAEDDENLKITIYIYPS